MDETLEMTDVMVEESGLLWDKLSKLKQPMINLEYVYPHLAPLADLWRRGQVTGVASRELLALSERRRAVGLSRPCREFSQRLPGRDTSENTCVGGRLAVERLRRCPDHSSFAG